MSKSTLNKKLKQTDPRSSFSRKRKIDMDTETGETTQASDNSQEKNAPSRTEAEEGPRKDVKQEVEDRKHIFKFSLNGKTYSVSCRSSMTVLQALNTSKIFRTEKDKKKNMEKEAIIQRNKEGFPRAAVKTDFPCCLIDNCETLDVNFIKTDGNNSTNPQTAPPSFRKNSKSEAFVSFWVRKDGGDKVICLLKSKVLRNAIKYICVYGVKGEKVKTALKRDGRFRNIIFKKHCGLYEFNTDTKHEMSIPVEDLDRKSFQVVVISGINQPDSQEDWTFVNPEHNEASGANEAGSDVPNQNPTNTEQEKKESESTQSKNHSAKRYNVKTIDGSEDLLEFLRAQFKDLVEILMQRENLKNNSEVQKFFRAEYDKSVQSFSEVFKIKKIMKLSKSVCQIRAGGSPRGTGFLLFGRYILTNAHVVKDYLQSPDRLLSTKCLDAAFDFERLKSSKTETEEDEALEEKLVSFKQEIPAYCYLKDADQNRLDFALLELDSADEINDRPELLKYYYPGPHPSSGEICIVGHPEGGIKRKDACYIIAKENLKEAVDKHINENREFFQVITQKNFEDKWAVHENQYTYDSCFFHGSSGSPVFDKDCYLIGIHTGGYVYPGKGGRTRSVKEYAYSMQPVLDMIRAQAKIKGLHEIVNILEPYCEKSRSENADYQNQSESEMDCAEEFEDP